MTDDLNKRAYEHAHKLHRGFTATYGVNRLVWYEVHDTKDTAFTRERQIKKWRRVWKLELIERDNPSWDDLASALL